MIVISLGPAMLQQCALNSLICSPSAVCGLAAGTTLALLCVQRRACFTIFPSSFLQTFHGTYLCGILHTTSKKILLVAWWTNKPRLRECSRCEVARLWSQSLAAAYLVRQLGCYLMASSFATTSAAITQYKYHGRIGLP